MRSASFAPELLSPMAEPPEQTSQPRGSLPNLKSSETRHAPPHRDSYRGLPLGDALLLGCTRPLGGRLPCVGTMPAAMPDACDAGSATRGCVVSAGSAAS